MLAVSIVGAMMKYMLPLMYELMDLYEMYEATTISLILEMKNGKEFLLTGTLGFVQKLPTTLMSETDSMVWVEALVYLGSGYAPFDLLENKGRKRLYESNEKKEYLREENDVEGYGNHCCISYVAFFKLHRLGAEAFVNTKSCKEVLIQKPQFLVITENGLLLNNHEFPLKAVKVLHMNHMSEIFAYHATSMSNTLGTSIVVFT
ncbi:hypothetical protein Tco_0622497 [Tanacetum coccineum]